MDGRMETDNECKISFVGDKNILKILVVVRVWGWEFRCSTGLRARLKVDGRAFAKYEQ